MTTMDRHQARLRRVLEHLDRNPEGAADVATLAAVAGVSPCHFHRRFGAELGLPVHRYVQLGRLKRAAHQLAFRPWQSVTEIAFDAGYDSPDASTGCPAAGKKHATRRCSASASASCLTPRRKTWWPCSTCPCGSTRIRRDLEACRMSDPAKDGSACAGS